MIPKNEKNQGLVGNEHLDSSQSSARDETQTVSNNTPKSLQNQGLSFLSAIWQPGDVHEIRAFDETGKIRYGYYDNPQVAEKHCRQVENTHEIYVVLNPCKAALMARHGNKPLKLAGKDPATGDKDIRCLYYLLIDCDPVRPSDIPSTDGELEKARVVAERIKTELGQPLIFGMSGNGYHCIYRHNSEKKEDLKAYLQALNKKYGTPEIQIDEGVFNPSRITKVLGISWSRKGEGYGDRQHRKSAVISVAKDGGVILNIPPAPEPEKKQKKTAPSAVNDKFDSLSYVRGIIADHNINVMMEKTLDGGGTRFCLDECLFDPSHKGNESAICVPNDGPITYQCFHNSCKGQKTWHDVKTLLGIDNHKDILCRDCGNPITFQDKRPVNLDGSRHFCRKPQPATITVEELLPLPVRPDDKDLFPIFVLPDHWQEYCRQVSVSMCAPVDFIAMPLFCIAGGLIGNSMRIERKRGWQESATIFWAGVGETGTCKSPAMKAAMKILDKLERELRKENEEKLAKFDHDLERYEFLKKDARKKGGDCPLEKPKRPLILRTFTSDFTVEAIGKMLGDNQRGLLIYKDELSGWFDGLNQYKNNGNDRQFFLSLWSNTPAPIDRVGRDPVYVHSPHAAIFGAIQPDKLVGIKNDADGFFERILYSWPARIPIRENEQEIDPAAAYLIEQDFRRLFKIPYPLSQQEETWIMSVETGAKHLFADWADENNEACEKAENDNLLGIFQKIKAYALRFALILSVLKNDQVATIDTMGSSITLAEYFYKNARRVFGELETTKEQKQVEKVIDWAKRKGLKVISVRDVVTYRVAGVKNAEEATALLEKILAYRYGKSVGNGKVELSSK